MAKTPEIPVSGDVLRWAREQRSLPIELAAKRLQMSVEKLESIESGEQDPSVAVLHNMVEKYKRPLIVLLLDEVPSDFTPLRDFRSLDIAAQGEYSPELMDEIRRVNLQREAYVDLSSELKNELARPLLPNNDNAAALGLDLRVFLEVDQLELQKIRKPEDALKYWSAKIEEKGILVLQTSRVKMSEMRGFSISQGLPMTIVLNGEDSPRAKIFTLLHELAHLSRRASGVCDLHSRPIGHSDIEVFCNAVAGEAILPREHLLAVPAVARHIEGQAWSDAELEAIQDVVGSGVSLEVILRRLVTFGKATADEYEKRSAEWAKIYQDLRKQRSAASKGGPPPHRVPLRDRGRPFVQSVFDAYSDGRVSLSEVSDLVGVRTKHLDNLQAEAYS